MTADLHEIWVYLSASPLLHLTLTLVAYQAGSWVYQQRQTQSAAQSGAAGGLPARRGADR